MAGVGTARLAEQRESAACDQIFVADDVFRSEEGNPRASVAPDVFVVFGAQNRLRPTYKLWEEPKAPDFVLEVASPSTWEDDEGRKGRLYERLGVREYWQYDPTGEHLPSRLKGRRLVEGAYEPQPVAQSLDGTLILRSETLGLDLRAMGKEMYFLDPTTGQRLLSRREQDAARRKEAAARIGEDRRGPLFRSCQSGRRKVLRNRAMSRVNALKMIKRRVRKAGLPAEICAHGFRVAAKAILTSIMVGRFHRHVSEQVQDRRRIIP